VPISIDDSFTKNEKADLIAASIKWTKASNNELCFKFLFVKVYEMDSLIYRVDGISTIYSGNMKWQLRVASRVKCELSERCGAVTIRGLKNKILSSDIIFINKKREFLNLATHEIGHILGIKHSSSLKDLMHEEVEERSRQIGNYISAADKAVLSCLINSSSILKWTNLCKYIRKK